MNRGQGNDKINDIMKLNEYIEITNEDNMELMARYPDKYFDLCITDPPYGIGISGQKEVKKGKKSDRKLHKQKNWDNAIPSKEYFNELFRISKNQIIWGANYFVDKLPITEAWICWYKKPFLKQQAHFELAWTSFKMKPKMIEYTYAGNCEGFKNVRVDYTKKSIHPAQKPENIYKLLLQDYAKQGDRIIDTHFGSGSIACAVHKANIIDKMDLSLVACELDKDYFESSIQRVKEALQTQSLF